MIVAIGASSVFAKNIATRFRLPLLVGAVLVFFVVLPSMLLYVGVDAAFFTEDILETFETSADRFDGTGSFISLVDMPLALRPFSYLFRPFPFEVATATQLIASLQNIIFLVFFISVVFRNFAVGAWSRDFGGIAMILFGLAALMLLANVTPNLGIAFRQKQMLVPPLLIAFVFFFINGRRQRETVSRNFSSTQGFTGPTAYPLNRP